MLDPVPIQCPYCGESIEVLVEASPESQRYTEDCQVCCRPIVLTVSLDEDGVPWVDARREDE
ncbi:CPXCG motif-containing cysteine-rich protein [Frateuria defendens]|uniref:CPXCG motif-containing cysteine-rich protein n=1 Tax=Frateuria defendens TaxID=2219559 RepID=UPI00066FE9E7|nr:CPXCG motif-containing cysteine-rich protein [Frateuria defendens]